MVGVIISGPTVSPKDRHLGQYRPSKDHDLRCPHRCLKSVSVAHPHGAAQVTTTRQLASSCSCFAVIRVVQKTPQTGAARGTTTHMRLAHARVSIQLCACGLNIVWSNCVTLPDTDIFTPGADQSGLALDCGSRTGETQHTIEYDDKGSTISGTLEHVHRDEKKAFDMIVDIGAVVTEQPQWPITERDKPKLLECIRSHDPEPKRHGHQKAPSRCTTLLNPQVSMQR